MPAIRGGKAGSIKRLKKSLKSGGGGSPTGRLEFIPEDGLTVRFLTEPEEWFEFFEHYDEGIEKGNRFVPCVEGCSYCDENPNNRPSRRYAASVVDTEENRSCVVKMPQTVAESLLKKYDRFQTIMDRDYFLSKEGQGKEGTTYDVTPEPPNSFNTNKYEVIDPEDVLMSILSALFVDGADDDDDDDDGDDDDLSDVDVQDTPPRPVSRAKKKVVRRKRPRD